MLFKTRLGKMPVQHPDRPSQVPPGRGQYQKIIHVPGIRHMAVSAEDVVGFRQVEGGQQGFCVQYNQTVPTGCHE
ncbi:hypothetical protein ACK1C8_004667 [Salmonella enterica]